MQCHGPELITLGGGGPAATVATNEESLRTSRPCLGAEISEDLQWDQERSRRE